MTWMFGLFRLALSLGFLSSWDDLRSLDRPLAVAQADCSCPVQTVGYQCAVPPPAPAAPADGSSYKVEVRQTGKRDCTLSWPGVTLRPNQRALVSSTVSGKTWLMSLHMKKAAGEKAAVEVGLTGRCGGEVHTYKGTFDVKIGVCNLTALGGHDLPEPLAVSLCVKKVHDAVAVAPLTCTMPAPRAVPPPVAMPAPLPVAPCFPVVGHVYPNPLPMPAPMMWPAPTPIQPCIAFAPAVPGKVVTLVKEGDRSRLCLKAAGLTSTGAKMTLDAGDVGKVSVAAGKKYVHLKGHDFTATADTVEVCGDHVKLCGHVKLACDKIGPGAEVKADCLCVKVLRGHFVELKKCECPAGGCCAPKVSSNRAN